MDHKWAIVLQNLLHCAVCYPVFLHREVDLTGTHVKENVCSCFKYNFKHCYELNTRSNLSVQTWLHNVPDWMIAFHVQHTSAQFSQSRSSKYLKICRENNSKTYLIIQKRWKHLNFLSIYFFSCFSHLMHCSIKFLSWGINMQKGRFINVLCVFQIWKIYVGGTCALLTYT